MAPKTTCKMHASASVASHDQVVAPLVSLAVNGLVDGETSSVLSLAVNGLIAGETSIVLSWAVNGLI